MLDDAGELSSTEPPIEFVKVHPMAAIFPMLPDDELAELAEDIRANGLLHPIIVDDDGELIDGRNRLSACKIAGVEPQYRIVRAEDALAYIASANLNRRHLNKGQQAMAMAMLYPEPGKGGRGNQSEARKVLVSSGFSRQRLDQARSVLRHSRALAEDVLANRDMSLDRALERVRNEQQEAESAGAKLVALRKLAPDLAEMVEDERLTLSEATAALTKRQEDAAKREDSVRKTLLRVSEGASSIVALANEEFVGELLERLEDEEFSEQWLSRVRLDHERIGEVKSGSDAFTKVLKHMARRR